METGTSHNTAADNGALKSVAGKSAIWSILHNTAKHGINFLVFLLLARLLTPEHFGLVALATAFVVLVNVFVEQGLGEAIIQRNDLQDEHLQAAFWSTIGLSVLLTLVVTACAPWIATAMKEPKLTYVLYGLSPLFVLTALATVQLSYLQRQFAFRSLTLRALLSNGIGGLIGIIMAFNGYGVWSLVGQQLGSNITSVLALWSASRWRPRFNFSTRHCGELYGFGKNIIGLNLLNFISRKSDDLIIGFFLGPVALGYYAVAYQLVLALEQFLSQGFDAIALSTLSRLQNAHDEMRKVFLWIVEIAAAVVLPAFAGVAMVAPELIITMVGAQWLPSSTVLQILAAVAALHSVFHFNHALLKATGRPDISFRLGLINTAANLLIFMLTVRWGIAALALGYTLRAYVLAPLGLLAIRRQINLKISTYLQMYVKPLTGTLLMCSIMYGTRHLLEHHFGTSGLLAAMCATGIVSYGAWVALCMPHLLSQAHSTIRSMKSKVIANPCRLVS